MLEVRREPGEDPERVIHLPVITGIRIDHDEGERTSPWLPLALLVLVVAVNLVMFRAEASPPVDLNDSGLHLSVTDWAATRVADGHNPFDGWYPNLGLGFPQTHHYQSLPHVVTGIAGMAVGVENAYHWSLYLLLAGWPIAVYLGCRLLGLGRWPSVAAAAVAPWVISQPGYGFEAPSYVWQGYGIWPQLWAAWLLPIAIGLSYRALRGQAPPAAAGAAIAATFLCHAIVGWLALAVVVLMPLLDWRDLARRFGRLALVLAGSLALVVWFVVPLFLDRAGADYTGYERDTFWYDSFGARQVMKWLISGELFDAGRLPVITVLAAVGLVVTCFEARAHVGPRVVLLLSGLSLALFFGRPTLGVVLDLLPYGRDLFYPRFIVGVQLGAIVLAGIGLAWLGEQLVEALSRFGPAPLVASITAMAGVFVLVWPVQDLWRYADDGRAFMASQRESEATDGDDVRDLTRLVRGGNGRTFAGSAASWGAQYKVGFVPVYAELLADDVDAVGYVLRVSSLPTAAEQDFDENDPAKVAAFGVRWLILPEDRLPSVAAREIASAGRHRLWLVTSSSGYAELVDGTEAIEADATTLRTVVANAFASGDIIADSRPVLRWRGEAGPVTALTSREGPPGDIGTSIVEPEHGRFTFEVDATRTAYLALAASWHPRWRATVDGEPVETAMLVPGTVAAVVPEGEHVVRFEYVGFPHTWALALGGLAGFAVVAGVPVLVRRRRLPSNPGQNESDVRSA